MQGSEKNQKDKDFSDFLYQNDSANPYHRYFFVILNVNVIINFNLEIIHDVPGVFALPSLCWSFHIRSEW